MIKPMLKITAQIITSFVVLSLFYFLIAVLFSVIPVHWQQGGNKEIEIYVRSNGVHAELVLPLVNEQKDWTKEGGIEPLTAAKARYLSIGWGDLIFYRNTPQWSDLTFPTAFKALFLKSAAAIHIDYYTHVQPNNRCKPVLLSNEQYREMVGYIEAGFKRDSQNRLIRLDNINYTQSDAFYAANGSYSLFFTCNTWTNQCLKQAGLKACLWTPFDKGILYQYRNKE